MALSAGRIWPLLLLIHAALSHLRRTERVLTASSCTRLGYVHPFPLEELDPFGVSEIARSIPYIADTSRLQEILSQAQARGQLRAVALGGSVTHGNSCTLPDGQSGTGCSWPALLEIWLRAR